MLQLQDPAATTVGSWAVEEPEWDHIDHEEEAVKVPDWKLLSELFERVHRHATGWDKVLSDVEKALASQGPIGKPSAP